MRDLHCSCAWKIVVSHSCLCIWFLFSNCSSNWAAFCHITDVCCQTNIQQLWRQVFCSCRLPSWTAISWH